MDELAERAAEEILRSFAAYKRGFLDVARRARERFLARDWRGAQADAVERLEVRGRALGPAVERLRGLLAERVADRALWKAIKGTYARLLPGRVDAELAETFFNSVTRRVFGTVGVEPEVEFTVEGLGNPPLAVDPAILIRGSGSLAGALGRFLTRHFAPWEFEDLDRDLALAARAVETRLGGPPGSVEVVAPLFYRNKGAYLVGRLRRGGETRPLVLALLNPSGRVVVDAVLVEEDEASIVFSFTQSYFQVDEEDAGGLVAFLKSIMPKKPVSELYTAIGFHKHGKTELYRYLLRHLAASDDLFEPAPGERGLVMIAFTLPSYDVVFKLIRDVFGPTKTSTRKEVQEKYELIFRHGRAGRLVDTQEFLDLELPRDRFSDPLLAILDRDAKESVRIDGARVVLSHGYTERRLVPLNLFFQRADAAACRRAAVDYGEALRELAASNIFPGDLLVKNFGVTRHGRVVFYDYDEVSFLTDVNFRWLPDDAEADSFWVGPNDVFPEELLPFLGLPQDAREAFVEAHADLLTPRFWFDTQKRVKAGDLFDVFPYPRERRLHPGPEGEAAAGPHDAFISLDRRNPGP